VQSARFGRGGARQWSLCNLCGCTIEHEQVEYEFSWYHAVAFRFHIQCHAIWQLAASDPRL